MIEKSRELITPINHEFYWSNSLVPMINKKYGEIRSNFNTEVKRVYISEIKDVSYQIIQPLLCLLKFIMHLTVLLMMITQAQLTDGNQNELRYTKEDHNMMKNPKVYHLQDKINRKKICYFMYGIRLYGSHHIMSRVAKNSHNVRFGLHSCSD